MITRENYEEFFLLYVDDELTMTTRAAVEQFVADNPDLKEEWEALLQCRVQPDQAHGFHDKDVLLHYESSLLSYIDGELDVHERQEVEQLVRLHPRAAEELHRLQMTVSHPDPSMVFPDKERLYAGRRRRAVMLPWLRAGVAAAVLGGAALLLFNRQHTPRPVVLVPKNILPVVTSHPPAALYPTVKDEQVQAAATVKDGGPKRKEGFADDGVPERRQASEKPSTREKKRPVDGVPVPSPQALATLTTPAIDTAGKSANTTVAVADPQPAGNQTTTGIAAVYIPREQSSFATQALMQQAEEDNTNNSTAELSAAPAKNKLRGIFRKVGRAFGKTADRDTDGQRQVLISAFQVALK